MDKQIFQTLFYLLFFILVHKCYNAQLKAKVTKRIAVDKIINAVRNDTDFQHKAYDFAAEVSDLFGPRLWGSVQLEKSIDFIKDKMVLDGFDNVKKEKLHNVTHWIRGRESLTLYSPRPLPTSIPVCGLGNSIGGNITGELVIFNSFEDLEEKSKDDKEKFKGKIFLFNEPFQSYKHNVKYRLHGPSIAAKYGATACIIRSIAPKTLGWPHTGILHYDLKYKKIPSAAISHEDANMFARMIDRGNQVILNLNMEDTTMAPTTSYNLVGEIKGRESPEKIALIGGHIDSWDIGPQTGANDDLSGVAVTYEAIRLLIKLKLRPKRTIRFIAWSGEEFGGENSGYNQYVEQHKDESANHFVAFESDLGTKRIHSFGYNGNSEYYKIVNDINFKYLKSKLNIKDVIDKFHIIGVDTKVLLDQWQLPVLVNNIEGAKSYDSKPDENNKMDNILDDYFLYHHSAIDTVDVLDKNAMDDNVIAIAALFYLLADV